MWNGGITRRDLIAGSTALLATAPGWAASIAAPSPLNFIVVGDWGRDGKAYQRDVAAQMTAEAARIGSRFVVSTGDNFYNFGVSSINDRQWDTSFEDIYRQDALQTRWYPVLGNHDYGGRITAQLARTGRDSRWHMPDRWHKMSFGGDGLPHADLFFIDTVAWAGKESFPFAFLGSSLDRYDQKIQKRWLTESLLDSTAPVKLVFGHHPVYSVGPHGGKANFDDLDRLLRRTGVTAYVNGHDHCLYHIRSKAMDYICSGGGSAELHKFTGVKTARDCVLPDFCRNGIDIYPPESPRWLSYVDRAGFASFSVTEQGVSFRLIDRSHAPGENTPIPARLPDPSIRIDEV